MDNKYDDYESWKHEALTNCKYTINMPEIARVLLLNYKIIRKYVRLGELKGFVYKNKFTTAKTWLEEFMDGKKDLFCVQSQRLMLYDTRTWNYPDRIPPSEKQLEFEARKKKRLSLDYDQYESFEEVLEEFDNDLTVHDIGMILSKHFDTIRKRLLAGKMKYKKDGLVYYVEKEWFLEYIKENGIHYDKRDKGILAYHEARYPEVVVYCVEPRSYKDLLSFLELSDKSSLFEYYTRPLMSAGYLRLTIPDAPHDNRQRYIATMVEIE